MNYPFILYKSGEDSIFNIHNNNNNNRLDKSPNPNEGILKSDKSSRYYDCHNKNNRLSLLW